MTITTHVTYVVKYLRCNLCLSHTSELHIQMICWNVTFVLWCLNPAMDCSSMNAVTSMRNTSVMFVADYFSFQLNIHSVQYTRLGWHQCTQCTKTVRSKCYRVFHERSHYIQIKCDLCPTSSTKEYTSQVVVNKHKRACMVQAGLLHVERTTSGSLVIHMTIDLIASNASKWRLTIGLKGLLFYIIWIWLKNLSSSLFGQTRER